jgi:hypothetical protein
LKFINGTNMQPCTFKLPSGFLKINLIRLLQTPDLKRFISFYMPSLMDNAGKLSPARDLSVNTGCSPVYNRNIIQ